VGAAKSLSEDALNNEGRALGKAGKWEEARKKFEAAYGKVGSPGPLFNLAWAEQNLGMHRAALKHYRIYLELPPTEKISADARANAQKYASECAAKLCTFEVRGATKVTIDGEAPAEVEPGSHKIEMDGAQGPKTKTSTCAANERVLVEYEEKSALPVATVAPTATGTATGTSTVPTPPPSERSEKGSWVVPGVLAAVGVVGLGVGIGLQVSATGARDNALALQQPGVCADRASAGCVALQDGLDSASGQRTGAAIAMIGGGVFVGAAVVSALVIKPWQTRVVRDGRLAPLLAPGTAGLAVGGKF